MNIINGYTKEQLTDLKLTKTKILKFKTHENLINYILSLEKKVMVNASVYYKISNGKEKWLWYSKSYSNGIIDFFKDKKIGVVNMFENYVEDKRILTCVSDDRYYLIGGIKLNNRKIADISWCPCFVFDQLLKRGITLQSYGYLKYCKYEDGNNFLNFINKIYEVADPKDAKKYC